MILLLDSQSFPCVYYFKKLTECKSIEIELYETYQKMSFRNRYVIFGANGLINLTIPLKGGREQKRIFKEVEIDFSEDWQNKHWKAIVSSYNRSPYFEFYQEDFKAVLFSQKNKLFEYNNEALTWCLGQLKMAFDISFTNKYKKLLENGLDLRNTILPKNFQHIDKNFQLEYAQVFGDRFGFQQNLSIIDLIFAVGPNAKSFLEISVK